MGNRTSSEESASNRPPEDPSPNSGEQMSYYQMAKAGYAQLINAIIRPPRCQYDVHLHLGPSTFTFCGRRFQRVDFCILNPRKMKICCSLWEPIPNDRPHQQLPCVIYMHGNSSARVEGIPQLALALSIGATYLTFDFSGSGLSEGEYVSLGVFEKDDLEAVIDHLRMVGTTSTIALWGRSMGAAAALLHGERDPTIAAMVLDSAFSDLTVLAEEIVEKGRQSGLFAPGILVRMVLSFVRSTIQKQANFDIREVSPIRCSHRCYIPALFIAAEHDDFVQPSHSRCIMEKYAGDKNLIVVPGDHNSARPLFMMTSVAIFLTNTLQVPESFMLPSEDSYPYICNFIPPWCVGDYSALRKSMDQFQHNSKSLDILDDDLETALAMSMEDLARHNSKNSVETQNKPPLPPSNDRVKNVNECTSAVNAGMTQERQDNIRSAVYGVFGGMKSSNTRTNEEFISIPLPPDMEDLPRAVAVNINHSNLPARNINKISSSNSNFASNRSLNSQASESSLSCSEVEQIMSLPEDTESGEPPVETGLICVVCSHLNPAGQRHCVDCRSHITWSLPSSPSFK